MKILTSIILCLLLIAKPHASEVIEIGIATTIKSKILNETRPYKVYLPPSYHEAENSYPVIYLLDGDVNRFKGFVGVLESLSTETLESQVVQAIVVAIPNTDRTRDLTPSELKQWTFKGQVLDNFEKTGNAPNFAAFFQNELIPEINSTYRTTNKKVLIGESFGGLFTAYTLLHIPDLFTDYLIIDPTALWDEDYLNKTYDAKFKDKTFNTNVFFAFANNSHLRDIGLTNYKWGSNFATKFIAKVDKQSHAQQQYFDNERHGTVAFLGWYNGLKFLLPNQGNN